MKVVAVVPSLNPEPLIINVIEELVVAGFSRIIVIDDGSGEEYRELFDKVAGFEGCKVLRHEVNKGKGRALKTSFEDYIVDIGDFIGLITLDADGQHNISDVINCAKTLVEYPNSLILGVRDFSKDNVPKKSVTGNNMMLKVLRYFFGISVSDSQTGLRGISNSFARELIYLEGERYEFETNMLFKAKKCGVQIKEVDIETVYINDNDASHYRPLVDSFRIIKTMMKFGASSIFSAFVDIGLFAIISFLLATIPPEIRYLIATGAARFCSAIVNFLLNKNTVFKSDESSKKSLLRYTVLCILQGFFSYLGMYFMAEALGFPAVASKILVDISLAVVSFNIQLKWVFAKKKNSYSHV